MTARIRARYILLVGIVAAVIIIIAATMAATARPSGPPDSKSLRVAVVTDALFTDKGWGAASQDAAEFIAKKYGFEVTSEDNVEIADIESTLKKYAQSRYDLVIAHGFQWGEPSLRVGKQYPDTKIVVFTGLVQSQNVASIFPMQQEGSFLLGALACMMTESGVIGYVGGEEYPNLINIFEGYVQGAKTVNPDVRIIGTYLNDWDNPEKGKESAMSIIQQGADVIFYVADSSGHGVIQAAEEKGIYALGAVQDQNSLAPGTVLSSFVLDVDKAYDQAVQAVVEGNFRGELLKPGLEKEKGASSDGIVYLAPFHSLDGEVPDEVKKRLEELTDDVLAKKLVVPERLEES
ncbi:MAG: BMP family lipoprotein [Nitrososphaera sp.]|uniref:BMP family lipoprotein n=1 Tax=Nitrososphaera sp. TaxID=1971748 RepID=UPI003D702055